MSSTHSSSSKKRKASSPKSTERVRSKQFSCGHLFVLLVGYCFFFLAVIHFVLLPSYTMSKRIIFPSSEKKSLLTNSVFTMSWDWIYFPLPKYSTYRYDIPVYYINLEVETQRNQYIEKHLKETGFQRIHRINAWTVDDVKERVRQRVTSTKTMLNPNEREIGCIASHLYAMYVAVHDPTNTNPYALIVEDDVSIPFAIDWSLMVEAAPKEFGILQLTTSHSAEMRRLWEEYSSMSKEKIESAATAAEGEGAAVRNVWDTLSLATLLKKLPHSKDQVLSSLPLQLSLLQWSLRANTSEYWSTQGYIINKAVLRPVLDGLIHEEHVATSSGKVPIITLLPYPDDPTCPHELAVLEQHPCILSYGRIVADVYLYNMFPPTYMSRIPMINGAVKNRVIALSSSIQSSQKTSIYLQEFATVEKIIETIRVNGSVYTAQSIHKMKKKKKKSNSIQYDAAGNHHGDVMHHNNRNSSSSISRSSWNMLRRREGKVMKKSKLLVDHRRQNGEITSEGRKEEMGRQILPTHKLFDEKDEVFLPPYFLSLP